MFSFLFFTRKKTAIIPPPFFLTEIPLCSEVAEEPVYLSVSVHQGFFLLFFYVFESLCEHPVVDLEIARGGTKVYEA